MYPVHLPQNDFPLDSDVRHAYEQCLTFEQDAQLAPEGTMMPKFRETSLIVTRLLGHALPLAPTQAGRIIIAREIIMCNEDRNRLDGLASLYVFGLCFSQSTKGVLNLPPGWTLDPSPRQVGHATSHLLQPSSETQNMGAANETLHQYTKDAVRGIVDEQHGVTRDESKGGKVQERLDENGERLKDKETAVNGDGS